MALGVGRKGSKEAKPWCTCNRRTGQWGDALEHDDQTEGVSEFLQAEEVDENDGSESHVSADCGAEDGGVDHQSGVSDAVSAQRRR